MRLSDRVQPAPNTPAVWLTVGEVAYMLGVAVSTVRMWVADGCLPSPRYCGKLEAFGADWWREYERAGVCMPGSFPVERLPIKLPGVKCFGNTTRDRRAVTKFPGRAPEKGARKSPKGGAK